MKIDLDPLVFINQFDGQRIVEIGQCPCGRKVYRTGPTSLGHAEPWCDLFFNLERTEAGCIAYLDRLEP
jgi:hypothetical protein